VQALESDNRALAADSLRRDVPQPERLSAEDWAGIIASVRFAYKSAVQDGLEPVLQDIREQMTDLSEDDLAFLSEVLTPDPAIDRRQEGVRVREGFLPNLVGASLTLDLRVIDPQVSAGTDVEVVPVAMMRLLFDEPVAGQEAVTFQLAGPTLEAFSEDLLQLRSSFNAISATTEPKFSVAPWAREAAE